MYLLFYCLLSKCGKCFWKPNLFLKTNSLTYSNLCCFLDSSVVKRISGNRLKVTVNNTSSSARFQTTANMIAFRLSAVTPCSHHSFMPGNGRHSHRIVKSDGVACKDADVHEQRIISTAQNKQEVHKTRAAYLSGLLSACSVVLPSLHKKYFKQEQKVER